MKSKLEKEVRFLKIYAIASTFLFSLLLLSSFRSSRNQTFEEIDVERINIVEKDGSLKMVISNQERQHPGIANGKVIERETARPPGMLFFNHAGDEMGGLVFGEKGELTTDRLFLGKNRDDYTVLVMQDMTGKPRIQMYVTPDGEAKLEFLDEKGKAIQSFPESN